MTVAGRTSAIVTELQKLPPAATVKPNAKRGKKRKDEDVSWLRRCQLTTGGERPHGYQREAKAEGHAQEGWTLCQES